MSFITAIGTAVPANRFSQSTISEFMVKAMQLDYEASRKLRTIFRASGIEYRHSVLDDYGKNDNYSFYANSKNFEPFPSTEKRITTYKNHALALSREAIEDCLAHRKNFSPDSISHLITVSCTGMYAPGLDIDIVKQFNLRSDIQRTAINFMGCYAAFNAIKAADAFCKADAKTSVLIVCTEMCSLHFQKEPTEDNLLANGLFADGAAAVLMENNSSGFTLTPVAFHNALSFTQEQHMAWNVGNTGFEMMLSAYVPDVIRGGIRELTSAMLNGLDKKITDIRHFSIHPGGKKILEAIEKELGIPKEKNLPAYHILRNYGNMSSPTVLFVLNEIFKNLIPDDDSEHILSLAFGPGLTLESMVLKIEYHA